MRGTEVNLARVFWDTNLFIYLLEQSALFGDQTRELRLRMRKRGDEMFTSALTVGELLVKPLREGRQDIANSYRAAFLQSHMTVLPFDFAAAEVFARIRQDPGVKPPDAIQLACAAAVGMDLFITNDDRLSQARVSGINFITSLSRAPI